MPAAPLPPGRWTFVDINGAPLVSGKVYHYAPGGLDSKDTWQDYAEQTLNDNPLTLDARGQAAIWGSGRYRQIVKDADGNTIWDQESFAPQPLQAADVVLTWTGNPSSATQWLGGCALTRAIDFAADFAGSEGVTPKTLPTGSYVVTIKIATVTVGTAICSTGGVWTFASTGHNPQSGGVGDTLDFYGPASADATVADFGLTLKGTLTE